jgi:hypothetical protein
VDRVVLAELAPRPRTQQQQPVAPEFQTRSPAALLKDMAVVVRLVLGEPVRLVARAPVVVPVDLL